MPWRERGTIGDAGASRTRVSGVAGADRRRARYTEVVDCHAVDETPEAGRTRGRPVSATATGNPSSHRERRGIGEDNRRSRGRLNSRRGTRRPRPDTAHPRARRQRCRTGDDTAQDGRCGMGGHCGMGLFLLRPGCHSIFRQPDEHPTGTTRAQPMPPKQLRLREPCCACEPHILPLGTRRSNPNQHCALGNVHRFV